MTENRRSYALLHYAGRAGDHNDKAMKASPLLVKHLASLLTVEPVVIGSPEKALNKGWKEELEIALPNLRSLSKHIDEVYNEDKIPIIALSRCSAALATLPIMIRHKPDTVVIWFDAHADINTPENTTTDFLGGLALSGPLGLWDSGLGKGLQVGMVILAGSRDIDDPEQEIIDRGIVKLVPPGKDFAKRLIDLVDGRPVYIHIDCDVLEPGLVPTDYKVPNGLTLEDLHHAASELARTSEIVGLEIAELEADDTDEGTEAAAKEIVDALMPLMEGGI